MAEGATVIGGDVLADNIGKYMARFLDEVNADMAVVRDTLKNKIRENISLSDHSLSDLAEMGHPYAARAPQHIHTPPYLVHSQSGRMLAGMVSGTKSASVASGRLIAEAYAGVGDDVEHAKHVEFGTSKMIPRDFLGGSLREVRGDILDTLRRSLKNVTVNFNGRKVKL